MDSLSKSEIATLFQQVLLICGPEGLIGKELFAIDGCKLPSNASKEWSGTHDELKKKKAKIEQRMEKKTIEKIGGDVMVAKWVFLQLRWVSDQER